MKHCTKCQILKSLDLFSSKKEAKDKKHSICKDCIRLAMKARYDAFPEIKKAQNKKRKDKIKLFINALKKEKGCCVCGETDPVVLDFHHLNPNEKNKDVSYWVHNKSKKKVLEESAKCVIVCSNDHRRLEANTIKLPTANMEL